MWGLTSLIEEDVPSGSPSKCRGRETSCRQPPRDPLICQPLRRTREGEWNRIRAHAETADPTIALRSPFDSLRPPAAKGPGEGDLQGSSRGEEHLHLMGGGGWPQPWLLEAGKEEESSPSQGQSAASVEKGSAPTSLNLSRGAPVKSASALRCAGSASGRSVAI